MKPTTASQAGGMPPATTSHAGGMPPTTASHAGGKLLAIIGHTSGTITIKKPKNIGCKPKYPCNFCKGDHLTHLFLILLDA